MFDSKDGLLLYLDEVIAIESECYSVNEIIGFIESMRIHVLDMPVLKLPMMPNRPLMPPSPPMPEKEHCTRTPSDFFYETVNTYTDLMDDAKWVGWIIAGGQF